MEEFPKQQPEREAQPEETPEWERVKTSGVDRIVGVNVEEDKILEYFERKMRAGGGRHGFEEEMTPEIRELISIINGYMDEYVGQYGGQSMSIPAEAVFIVDKNKIPDEGFSVLKEKAKTCGGLWALLAQKIVILGLFSEGQKIEFSRKLVHEMLHARSFISMHATERPKNKGFELEKNGKTVTLENRRSGLSMYDSEFDYLAGLDEAMTEELSTRFDALYFRNLPQVIDEYEDRESIIRFIAEQKGVSIDEVRPNVAHVEFRETTALGRKYTAFAPVYSKERGKLYKLLKDIHEANPDEFPTEEDVFALLARAKFTGRMLDLARVIEKTYGKGAFKRMAEESKDWKKKSREKK